MTGYKDAWDSAEVPKSKLGEWPRFSEVWSLIERQLGVEAEVAIRIVREALEDGRVRAIVPAWRYPPDSKERDHWVEIYEPWIDPDFAAALTAVAGGPEVLDLDFPPQVTPAGLKHIDFDTGTLAGFEVLISGVDVELELRDVLGASGSSKAASGEVGKAPSAASGADPTPNSTKKRRAVEVPPHIAAAVRDWAMAYKKEKGERVRVNYIVDRCVKEFSCIKDVAKAAYQLLPHPELRIGPANQRHRS